MDQEEREDDLSVNLSWPGAAREQRTAPPDRPRPAERAPSAPSAKRQAQRPTAPRPQKAPSGAASRSATPAASAPRRARPPEAANGAPASETLVSILEHLSTLSRLVTGTSKASTAELNGLGARVEKAVSELDALHLRVLRSLAGFDALRIRVQKEMADRPPLSDEDVERIADAVTERLLVHVRVETEGGR